MRPLLFLACCVMLAAANLVCLWLFSQPVRRAPVVPLRATPPELHPLSELLYIDQSKTIWL